MQNFNQGAIVLTFCIVIAMVSSLIVLLNKLLSRILNKNTSFNSRLNEKQFECGLNPTGGFATRLSISYFMVAAAFLIFELEGAILLAWAVDFNNLGFTGVITAVTFIVILLLGLFYMIRKGALKL